MKLLVITQKVDENDDVLGFFHGWLEEFSLRFEKVIVLALEKENHRLPENVRVLSLGKEMKMSRLSYLANFYRHIIRERRNYDAVLVHMNQEYVLLGALLWKLWGKKVALWRNHYAGNLFTRLAVMLSDKVFCTSRHSFTARFRKAVIMPVGVDISLFSPSKEIPRASSSILSLSRIAPSKKLEVIREALRVLLCKNIPFSASFYGSPSHANLVYGEKFARETNEGKLKGRVTVRPGVPNKETPAIYRTHLIFVNASPSGMYDKTIFEAMASGCLVAVSNKDLAKEIDIRFIFKEGDAGHLAEKLEALLALPAPEREAYGKQLREFVVERHSLKKLGEELAHSF